MSRLTPELAKSRSRCAGRTTVVPPASLPAPQRMLISALLEAAKAAALRRGVHTDTKTVAPTGGERGSGRLRLAPAGSGTPSSAGTDPRRLVAAGSGRLRQSSGAGNAPAAVGPAGSGGRSAEGS